MFIFVTAYFIEMLGINHPAAIGFVFHTLQELRAGMVIFLTAPAYLQQPYTSGDYCVEKY
ncbi:hypothetical protein [Microcoleus sp. LEGE 07076]|uniref:hypothetical protein n=1 Tax=Microcoleus sp. LEGE 07076 TaxID=915322 RepID=UPI001D132A6A|nr:hypothetical protein [Microcoleus sp. LEGE 07076]